MNGTLAIWYEPLAVRQDESREKTSTNAILRPRLEIHFNLWRDLPTGINFLDIGLKISKHKNVKRIYVYFPVIVKKDQIKDLFPVLQYSNTISTVFNTVIDSNPSGDLEFSTEIGGNPFAIVHRIRVEEDIEIELVEQSKGGSGSKIILNERFCARLRADTSQDQYLRFRLALTGACKTLFTQDVVSIDKVFVSSAHRLELTEIRVNETRSFPQEIARFARNNSFVIDRVHYFLVRELGNTLVTQHAPLRKVRRLEPKLWAAYLRGEPISDTRAKQEEALASKMVIYHWKEEGSETKPIVDFTAFCCFQSNNPGLIFYIIALVLLGAAGSTISSLGSGYGPRVSLLFYFVGVGLLWLTSWLGVWSWIARVLRSWTRRAMDIASGADR